MSQRSILGAILFLLYTTDLEEGVTRKILKFADDTKLFRELRVVVDGEVSSWKSVLSEVSQRSILGAILFLLYTTDLEEGVTRKILKFADDTKLFRELRKLMRWCVNVRKTLPPDAIFIEVPTLLFHIRFS